MNGHRLTTKTASPIPAQGTVGHGRPRWRWKDQACLEL